MTRFHKSRIKSNKIAVLCTRGVEAPSWATSSLFPILETLKKIKMNEIVRKVDLVGRELVPELEKIIHKAKKKMNGDK